MRSGTKAGSALRDLGVVLLAACAQTPPQVASTSPTSDSPHPIVARPDASAVDAAPRYALAIRFRATRDGDRPDVPIGPDSLLVALRFGPGGQMSLHLRNVPSPSGIEWLAARRGR